MPEGDSIHRVATALRPLVVGVPLVRVHVGGVVREELAGAKATAVTPHGKHMMIELDRGWELRIHLGMNGRWRRYRSPRTAPTHASLILVTATDELACLRAPTVELTARRDPRRARATASLGPDVLADDFDPAVAAARARHFGAAPIGVVLLDQRVAAGIGNVYKSEVLWLESQSPFTPTSALTDEQLIALYARARVLMRANLGPGRRVTRTGPRGGRSPDDRYWAYRRARRPCSRCQTPITTAVQGEQLRRTYYCPRCQPASPPTTPSLPPSALP
jgi:endonuclease VIII